MRKFEELDQYEKGKALKHIRENMPFDIADIKAKDEFFEDGFVLTIAEHAMYLDPSDPQSPIGTTILTPRLE